MGKRRIFLVDDKDDVIELLVPMLERYGYDVTATMDGEKALEILRSDEHFDLCLVDLRMSPVNGLEILAAGREARPDVPILLISAYGDEDMIKRAFELGCTRFIKKPLYLRSVMDPIREVLKQAPLPNLDKLDDLKDEWPEFNS